MERCDFSGNSDFDYFLPKAKADDVCSQQEADFTGRETYIIERFDEDFDCYPKERCCGECFDQPCAYTPRYPRTRRPETFIKKPPKSTDKAIKRASTAVIETSEFCNHDWEHKGNRTFLLQFTRSGIAAARDRTDHCYAAEHSTCQDFWAFVTNHDELDNAIKDGSFFHKGRLIRMDCGPPKKSIDRGLENLISTKNKPKYSPSKEALRQRNIVIHEEENQRRERIHNRWIALNRKSGQDMMNPKTVKVKILQNVQKKVSKPKPCGSFADCTNPKVDDVFREMDVFDDASKNPVLGRCDLRQARRPEYVCPLPYIPDEVIGENDYTMEDDNTSSSTQ